MPAKGAPLAELKVKGIKRIHAPDLSIGQPFGSGITLLICWLRLLESVVGLDTTLMSEMGCIGISNVEKKQ